jgi:hypothetical protein
MENKYLIGLGAIALGMFAYSRYAKKDDSGQGEDPNTGGGGGGIGGGGFMPNLPTPPIPPTPPTPPTPPSRPPNQGRIIDISSSKKDTIPTKAITSSVEAQKLQTVTNTGITGIGTGVRTGTGTATTVGTGAGSYMTTKVGGNVLTPFKPFDGSGNKCKTPIYLNDLVRSWNRP